MDTKSVTLTLLVTIDVSADTDSRAEDIARRFVEGIFQGANDGFMDGWNSVETTGEVIDVRMDVEGEADVSPAESEPPICQHCGDDLTSNPCANCNGFNEAGASL